MGVSDHSWFTDWKQIRGQLIYIVCEIICIINNHIDW